jgi:hypothetical protein
MRLPARAAAALLPVALAGCVFGSRGRAARGAGSTDAATLEVRNNYQGPVDVYVVRGGTATAIRLGQVPTSRVRRFRVDGTIIGGFPNVTFVAQSSGSAVRASSGSLTVRGGDFVQFNVTQDLRSSTAFVQ